VVIVKILFILFFYCSICLGFDQSSSLFQPVSNIEETIHRFAGLKDHFYKKNDHRLIFTEIYLEVTKLINSELLLKKFDNPEWVNLIVSEFGNYYISALRNFERGEYRKVPSPWLTSFKINQKATYKVSAQLLLAMNGHIFYDLPHSLKNTFNMGFSPEVVKRDYFYLNQMFEDKVPSINLLLKKQHEYLYPNNKGIKDYLALKILKSMREKAWRFGLGLNSRYAVKRLNTNIEIAKTCKDNANYLLRGHFLIPSY